MYSAPTPASNVTGAVMGSHVRRRPRWLGPNGGGGGLELQQQPCDLPRICHDGNRVMTSSIHDTMNGHDNPHDSTFFIPKPEGPLPPNTTRACSACK